MIARGDDRGPGAEQFDALLAADSASARRILSIDDGEIGRQLLLQALEPLVERVAPRFADHVTEKKNADH